MEFRFSCLSEISSWKEQKIHMPSRLCIILCLRFAPKPLCLEGRSNTNFGISFFHLSLSYLRQREKVSSIQLRRPEMWNFAFHVWVRYISSWKQQKVHIPRRLCIILCLRFAPKPLCLEGRSNTNFGISFFQLSLSYLRQREKVCSIQLLSNSNPLIN